MEKYIVSSNQQFMIPLRKLLWRWEGPERIKKFLWTVAHDSITANENRARRHFALLRPGDRTHLFTGELIQGWATTIFGDGGMIEEYLVLVLLSSQAL
ncbi:hypothetical protein OIU74_022008 [Salix koriyanagi]|uniref:Reverse transcriptase zinc-binding domain-containing protein n=1 Tax=Salix koriyanagi TaxID=2511006 RepID=A0A9Q0WJ63_9ROSI|nr:hypothetical protein OIU74_022008 [Salix koriyanagi]